MYRPFIAPKKAVAETTATRPKRNAVPKEVIDWDLKVNHTIEWIAGYRIYEEDQAKSNIMGVSDVMTMTILDSATALFTAGAATIVASLLL